KRGFLDATALADYLVRRGLPFRDAHRVVGGLVKECAASGKALADLSLAQLRRHSPLFGKDVQAALGPENCVANYRSLGSTAPKLVKKQLDSWAKRLC
ncbi:MAG: argininosuccinate lyase, partial [Planctomycetes bacterium]|nr:argininosuccinate lyase [Planctomycetota bacterium]